MKTTGSVLSFVLCLVLSSEGAPGQRLQVSPARALMDQELTAWPKVLKFLNRSLGVT